MMDQTFSPTKRNPKTTTGSALIAIIAAILIFSVLAASLVPMIGSSSRQAAISALADEAYMLAESGYRLVESRYRNGESIEAMDGETFTLADNGGEFKLRIYSYFYEIFSAAGNQITANPPGRMPLNNDEDGDQIQFSTGTSLLSIDGNLYTISGYSPEALNQESNLIFTLDSQVEALQPGTIAYPAALSNSWVWDEDTGGSLAYQAGQGGLFPLRHGQIMVGGGIKLNYRYNNRDQHRFEGVTNPESPNIDPAIGINSPIVLTNYSRIHVTGIASGNEREVVYYNALASQLPSTVFEDTTPSEFTVTEPDTTTVEIGSPDASGNQALMITQAEYNRRALLELDSAAAKKALGYYRSYAGGYLSYDAQVKVGFYDDVSPFPSVAFLNSPIPTSIYVASGLSFRLNQVSSNLSYNGYGISFVRGTYETLDGIPNGIVPPDQNDQPMIVLWYQTIGSDGNVSRQWLAYKKMVSKIYPVNEFDAVINDWSPSGAWSIQSGLGRNYSDALIYDGNTGGTVTSPDLVIDCPVPPPLCDEGSQIVLKFWARGPTRILRVISNGTILPGISPSLAEPPDVWNPYVVDLSSQVTTGDSIRIEFEVSSGSEIDWAIDDVEIRYQWPAHNSTLAVRLQEATMVKFNSGGTESFEVGDRVYGQNSGVIGTIIANPLVNDPSWSAGTASGAVLLNDLSSSTPFETGERILSIGHSIRGANVDDAYTPATDAKTNIIKAYYASESGNPPGSNDPLDAQTLAYPRRVAGENLRWPVNEGSEWTAERDYFRLIQWDMVNDAGVSNLESIPVFYGGAVAVDDTVLRHTHPSFQSQPLTAGPIVELGLHAYGSGTTNIYFDDFGLKLVAPPSRGGFTAPFQQ